MKRLVVSTLAGVVLVMALAAGTHADWKLDDGHKMHYPQLPDPMGWDVDITNRWVADDWMCTQTGPVADIHFWISWQGDRIGQIQQVLVQVFSDIPANAPGDPTPTPYSRPGEPLTPIRIFDPLQFVVVPAGAGPQGWYTPGTSEVIPIDHQQFFQVNIPLIDDPFIQQEGTLYWLALHVIPINNPDPEGLPFLAGWKTSLDHFQDDAVYDIGGLVQWQELRDPLEPTISLDMAFVITPEPATLALMLLGGLLITRRRGARRG